MTEQSLQGLVLEALAVSGLDGDQLTNLASHLLWRIGRDGDDGPLTVRVGLASNASAFSDLPRLKNASDAEILEAVEAKSLRVEWVGHHLG